MNWADSILELAWLLVATYAGAGATYLAFALAVVNPVSTWRQRRRNARVATARKQADINRQALATVTRIETTYLEAQRLLREQAEQARRR